MANLTSATSIRQVSSGYVAEVQVELYAGSKAYQGAMICRRTADGYAVRAGTADTGPVQGVAKADSATCVASGDTNVNLLTGAFVRAKHSVRPPVLANIGNKVYASDDQTVSNTSSDGPIAGILVGFEDTSGDAIVLISPAIAEALALESDLASTANLLGASKIGIEDSATKITATNVETALAEIALWKYNIGLTTNAKGASLVGIEDSATKITATNVETALAEIALWKYNTGLTTNGNGASLFGVEDSANKITATNVETALAEIALWKYNTTLTTNTNGASLIAIEDAGNFTTAANVEAALAEHYQNVRSVTCTKEIPVYPSMLAAGTPMAAFADDAGGSSPGVTLVDSEGMGIRWNNQAGQTAVWTRFTMPHDIDITADASLELYASKTGATGADATTFTVTAFNQATSALHDADANFGGTTSAMSGTATAKTVQKVTLTLALADLGLAGAPVSLSFKPTDGTLGTDDVILFGMNLVYKRKVKTS